MASISHHKTAMSSPAVIESGGYNQEARQDPATSAGYIYSSTGDDVEAYMQDVVPFLPAFISFGPVASANDLSLGLPGQNAIPSTTTIYPYEGAAPDTLPRTLTINAGATTLEFTLIAKIVSLTPVASATPDSSGDAGRDSSRRAGGGEAARAGRSGMSQGDPQPYLGTGGERIEGGDYQSQRADKREAA